MIAIIAILTALGAWAAFAVIGNQYRRNTDATIRVVNKVLQDHWKFVIDEARKDTPISTAVLNLAGNYPELRKSAVIKFCLMEAFPKSFSEIGSSANPPFVYQADGSGNFYIPPSQRRYLSRYQTQIAPLYSLNPVNPFINTKPVMQSSAFALPFQSHAGELR